MSKKCVAPECENVFPGSMSFFRFPLDPGRCHKWLKFCGLQDKIRSSQDVKENMRVCKSHFLETDYYYTGVKMRLKSSAVPSIHSNGTVEPTSIPRPTYPTRLMANKMAESLLEPFTDTRMSTTIFEDEVENRISVNAEKSKRTYSRSPRNRMQKRIGSSTVESTTDSNGLMSQLDVDMLSRIKERTEIQLEIPMKEEMLSDDEMNCDSVGEKRLDSCEPPDPHLLTPKQEISDIPNEETDVLHSALLIPKQEVMDSSYEEDELKPPVAVFIPSPKHDEEMTANEEDPFAFIGIAESGQTAAGKSTSTVQCINPDSNKPCAHYFSNEEEQQVCAKFCFLLGNDPAKAFKKLTKAFADDVVSETQVYLWFDLYKKDQL